MRLYRIRGCYFEQVILKDSALSCLGVYCTKLFNHIYNNLRLGIVFMRGKKMNKVEIKEFDVCHQFAHDIQFLIPLVEREFNITHLVFRNYVVIFIYYNKNSYGNRIQAFFKE